ncbi:hypothetical protein B566_EDAN013447 [Ephemera danica]|nr:hypothetical protein B566_EDAN013447 [Ephemera danica]
MSGRDTGHLCVHCLAKLNVCLDLSQSSEKALARFRRHKNLWGPKQFVKPESVDDSMDGMANDTSSPGDASAPSPTAITDFLEVSLGLEANKKSAKKGKKKTANVPFISTDEMDNLQDSQILQHSSCVVTKSQITFVVADPIDKAPKPKLSLVLINMEESQMNNRGVMLEKVTRIFKDVKKRFETRQAQSRETRSGDFNTSTQLLHSCRYCKCSFFVKEEMVSHFESLHPDEVVSCNQCEEKVCGPQPTHSKHMELHKVLEEDQLLENFLTTIVKKSDDSTTDTYEPEFVLIPLGNYLPNTDSKLSVVLHSKIIRSIHRNKFIKPEMKVKIIRSLKTLTSKFHFGVGEIQVECDKCKKKMGKRSLQSHMRIVHNPRRNRCCHCKSFIIRKHSLQSHIESRHNGGKDLICKVCDGRYRATGRKQPHMMPTSDFPFKCDFKSCNKVYEKQETLVNHMQNAHRPKPDPPPCLCDLCGKVYKHKSTLRHHIKDFHFPGGNAQVYTCEICGVTYSRRCSLVSHKMSLHQPRVRCEICGKAYVRSNLKTHMQIHEQPKLPCKYCGKLFSRKDTHRILGCTICKYVTFKSVKAMEEHRLKHERGEEIVLPPYLQPKQCHICSLLLPNAARLTVHMKTHEREDRSYVGGLPLKKSETTIPCYTCLIRFNTKESYDIHVQSYHPHGVPVLTSKAKGAKFLYQCRYCAKNFSKKDACNDHEAVHRGEKKYSCNFCGKRFGHNCDKYTHQKKCNLRYGC